MERLEEVAELIENVTNANLKDNELATFARELANMLDGISFDRLREICEAEKDGRLVVLPQKPNDAYYHRNYSTGELELNIELHGSQPDGKYEEFDGCAYWE